MTSATAQDQSVQGRPSVFGTILLLLLAYPILQIIYNTYFHPLSKVPGPLTWSASRLPFIRALLKGTIVHDIQKLHRIYGPILRIAPDEVTFAQPESWNDIFQPRQTTPSSGSRQNEFLKDPIWWKRQPGQPNSLLSAIDPIDHARMRKALSPAFTPRALRAQEPFIHRYVNLLVERLREAVLNNDKPDNEIDIGPWLNFATFDIFGDLGFGESFDCLENSRYHPWIAIVFNSVKAVAYVAAARYYPAIYNLLMKCIPASLKKMQQDHFQQIVDKVRWRMNYEVQRPDIMSYVIGSEGDGKGMSTDEIDITLMVLTTAGSETTATVLSGTMNYLVLNSDKLEMLSKEIRARFATGSDMSLDGLNELPYLNAVITEGLRLCTPVPWMLPRRVPPEGGTVCGVWLPGNTPVSIQAYALNRDGGYFHRPDSFHPERWLAESKDSAFGKDRRDGFQPFSVGPRSCMGQNLAWAEMRLILAKLVWNFDFEAAKDPGRRLNWEDLRTFLLVEKRPIYVRLRPRAV